MSQFSALEYRGQIKLFCCILVNAISREPLVRMTLDFGCRHTLAWPQDEKVLVCLSDFRALVLRTADPNHS